LEKQAALVSEHLPVTMLSVGMWCDQHASMVMEAAGSSEVVVHLYQITVKLVYNVIKDWIFCVVVNECCSEYYNVIFNSKELSGTTEYLKL
jgi:hypothetical protein